MTSDETGWLRRADAADSSTTRPERDAAASPFEGLTSMADLYSHLAPEDRAEYDAARHQLLHTLDHLPRNGQEAWVGELRADLDREDLAIRRWERDAADTIGPPGPNHSRRFE